MAFTLIELLVAMGIIVLLLGMGTLAFNTLTGRRSTSMAQSQVAAMLGKARAIAMNYTSDTSGSTFGVAFFRDPDTDRTAMAIVQRTEGGGGDPDPYDNYKGWAVGIHYQVGDRVVAIVNDTDEGLSRGGKPEVRRFRCKVDHISASHAVDGPPVSGSGYPLSNTNWGEVSGGNITVISDTLELLPVGVGVQTVVDSTSAVQDRYLRTGLVLFDRMGRLEHQYYQIAPDKTIGMKLHLTNTIGNGSSLYSQMGILIYDLEGYRNQPDFAEGDFTALINIPNVAKPASLTIKRNLENYLDQNSSLFMINRYSGELTKAR